MPNALHSNDDRSIVITRIVKAPRGKVWKLWSEREHLEQWWGPDGFSVTTESFDFRVGGAWKFVMHGPDGRDYGNKLTFTEIVEFESLSYFMEGDDDLEPIHFKVKTTFEKIGDKTKVTMRAIFPTAGERDKVAQDHGAVEGGKQTLNRLNEHVTKA